MTPSLGDFKTRNPEKYNALMDLMKENGITDVNEGKRLYKEKYGTKK